MTQEFVHMNWNQFTESAKVAFKNLWTSGDFTDVTLACADGEQVKAHKVILSSCSPFFKKILLDNSHQHPLIYMKGCDMKYIKELLQFVYTGEVEVENEVLTNFLEAADELQISGLTKTDLKPEQENGNLQKETKAGKNDDKKMQTVSEDSVYQCRTCNKNFTTKTNLKAHMLSIHNGVKHECRYCPYKSGFKQNLRKHIQNKHNTNTLPPLEPLELAPLELDPIELEPLELGQVSKTEESSEIYETNESTMKPLEQMLKTEELEDILETNEPSEISSNFSGYFCDHCNIEVRSGKALTKHRSEEHPGLGFYCSDCAKEFKSNANLKLHKRAVHEGVKIPCKSCDSIFTNPSNLNAHKKKKHSL